MAENKKFTRLINSDGTKQAVALDMVSFDEQTKKLTLYSSVDNTIKEETTIPASEVDITLSQSGLAADAKATGDAVKDVVKVGGTASGFTGIIVGTGEEEIELVEQKDFDAEIAKLNAKVGTPLVANTASAMVDTTKIYVYTGNENGYVNGNWYFYNGTNWESGGVYNAVAVQTDKTLTQENKAADAKETGDQISELKEDFTTTASKEDMLKSFPTDTASGSVANFADGANVPVKSLIVNIDPVQEGSGDPSPTNVRPISGWSEVNVEHTGENVFDENAFVQYGATKQSDGSWLTTNLYQFYGKVAYAPPTGYTGQLAVTFKRKTESGKQSLRLIINYTDGTNVTLGFSNATGNWDTYTLVTNESKTVANIKFDYGSGVATYFNLLVAFATTVTPYEPYSGQSITIPLGQTVYGGKLDVLSGVLTVDRAMVNMGTLNWSYSPSDSEFYATISGIKSSTHNVICDRYINRANPSGKYIVCVAKILRLYDSSYTDAATLKAALSGAQLVYELATPITVQLTPHEVTALLGSNNVWADTGDTEVTYRADPTLYISRLTEPDADMIADANITSGQYFMVGNTLYKATTNIASGASIVPNVNCTRKSLSEALNELNA